MQAAGIWITILYGVYLYGEKCSGITVRSLRSAVPAAARKTHLERRRNRETRWRRSSRMPEPCGIDGFRMRIVSRAENSLKKDLDGLFFVYRILNLCMCVYRGDWTAIKMLRKK